MLCLFFQATQRFMVAFSPLHSSFFFFFETRTVDEHSSYWRWKRILPLSLLLPTVYFDHLLTCTCLCLFCIVSFWLSCLVLSCAQVCTRLCRRRLSSRRTIWTVFSFFFCLLVASLCLSFSRLCGAIVFLLFPVSRYVVFLDLFLCVRVLPSVARRVACRLFICVCERVHSPVCARWVRTIVDVRPRRVRTLEKETPTQIKKALLWRTAFMCFYCCPSACAEVTMGSSPWSDGTELMDTLSRLCFPTNTCRPTGVSVPVFLFRCCTKDWQRADQVPVVSKE